MENTINVTNENSYFDGRLLQLIAWRILGSLVTICTLGICYPWAFCMTYAFCIENMYE